jgi:hypothetical protein
MVATTATKFFNDISLFKVLTFLHPLLFVSVLKTAVPEPRFCVTGREG